MVKSNKPNSLFSHIFIYKIKYVKMRQNQQKFRSVMTKFSNGACIGAIN